MTLGTVIDDDTVLVSSDKSANEIDFKSLENQILKSAMEQYRTDNKTKLYSVFERDIPTERKLTLERINELAVGINSDLNKVVEANEYVLQSILVDAYTGRAYEAIYSNINTFYKLEYPKLEETDDPNVLEEVKNAIDNFNQFIDINKIIKDSVAGTIREGNYSLYLRFKKNSKNEIESVTIDHYPLKVCYPSDYCINGENLLQININELSSRLMKTYPRSRKTKKAIYFKEISDEISNNYPEEVVDAYNNKETYVKLDDRFSGYMKINYMDKKFGVSPFFKALKSILVLNNIEAADIADSKTRSKKIIFQKLRKELLGDKGERKGFPEMQYAHSAAAQAIKTNFCLYTGPAFVEDLSYVIDNSNNDNNANLIKIYTSRLLTALGISFADSELSSFSTANISVEQLMRTINAISEQLERILNKYYQIYLESIGLPKEFAPLIHIIDSEMMDWSLRKEFAKFAYDTLHVSRDTVFKLVGLDLDDEHNRRKFENESDCDEVFTPRKTSYDNSSETVNNESETEDGRKSRVDEDLNEDQKLLDQEYNETARK